MLSNSEPYLIGYIDHGRKLVIIETGGTHQRTVDTRDFQIGADVLVVNATTVENQHFFGHTLAIEVGDLGTHVFYGLLNLIWLSHNAVEGTDSPYRLIYQHDVVKIPTSN